MTPFYLGSVLVPDVAFPRPEDVDVEFMRYRLANMRRFSGHPDALTVAQHQRLCGVLASRIGYAPQVVQWAEHHDDHEYATGDIATPVQKAIGMRRLRELQERWDIAICGALGIPVPTPDVRKQVAVVDAVAFAIEWLWCLDRRTDELRLSEAILSLADQHRSALLAVW